MSTSDISISERANAEELFVRLLAQHENDLYRYVQSLVFDRSAVDDIMQEVAVALWGKFDQYDSGRPFIPWACRFAYFEVLKHRSKAGRSKLVFGENLLEMLASDYDGEQEIIRARRAALEDCLAKLPLADRELIELRYNSDQTVQSVAQDRQYSVHKLYHSLERIRRSLMECARNTLRREGYEEIA